MTASSTRQLPRAPGGLAQRDHLGVRGGVLAQLALVVGRRNDLAVAHDHRADRHVLVFQRTLGLAQGQAHEVVVAWEEALAHRSRPRCLRQCLRRRIVPAHHHYPNPMLSPTSSPNPPPARSPDLDPALRSGPPWRHCSAHTLPAARGRRRPQRYAPDEIVVRYAPATAPTAAPSPPRVAGTRRTGVAERRTPGCCASRPA